MEELEYEAKTIYSQLDCFKDFSQGRCHIAF